MTFKDIVVHVRDGEGEASCVNVAIDLAVAHDAHLSAVYIPPRLDIPASIEAQIPASVLRAHAEATREGTARVRAAFEELARRAGARAEWRSAEGDAAEVLNLSSRYADLVVMGQAKDGGSMLDEALVDRVALGSGRPVLVVPYIGVRQPLGERVYVAWNASREAVRAVSDALPFLQRAKVVKVIAINPGGDEHGEIPCADMCTHLARHGVRAEAYQVESGGVSVGNMLLSRLADDGADLLVMGAYGHSRLRELVLGGATRHLLEHMTVPVLMSH